MCFNFPKQQSVNAQSSCLKNRPGWLSFSKQRQKLDRSRSMSSSQERRRQWGREKGAVRREEGNHGYNTMMTTKRMHTEVRAGWRHSRVMDEVQEKLWLPELWWAAGYPGFVFERGPLRPGGSLLLLTVTASDEKQPSHSFQCERKRRRKSDGKTAAWRGWICAP